MKRLKQLITIVLLLTLLMACNYSPGEPNTNTERGEDNNLQIDEIDNISNQKRSNESMSLYKEEVLENVKNYAKNTENNENNELYNADNNKATEFPKEMVAAQTNTNTDSERRLPNQNNFDKSSSTYTMDISAYTIDGKPFNKKFESNNPNDTFKFYEIEVNSNKKKTYEVTMNYKGEVQKKEKVREEIIKQGSPNSNDSRVETIVVELGDPKLTHEDTIIYQDIDFKTIVRQDETLPLGQTKVIQEGVVGKAKVTMRKEFVNGEHYHTHAYKTEVIKAAQDKIIVEGTKVPLGNSGMKFNTMEEASAWADKVTNDPDNKWYGRNAFIFSINESDTAFSVDFF